MIENPLGAKKAGSTLGAANISVTDDPLDLASAVPVNPPSDSFSFENPLVATAASDVVLLPAGWSTKTSRNGSVFYAHTDGRKQKHVPVATSVATATAVEPLTAPSVADVALPDGWRRTTSKSGTIFYTHVDGRKQKSVPVE